MVYLVKNSWSTHEPDCLLEGEEDRVTGLYQLVTDVAHVLEPSQGLLRID